MQSLLRTQVTVIRLQGLHPQISRILLQWMEETLASTVHFLQVDPGLVEAGC